MEEERVTRYCARLCSTLSTAARKSRLFARAISISFRKRSSAKKLRQARLAACPTRVSLGPGYFAATGAAGRSYLGIIVQPAASRTALTKASWRPLLAAPYENTPPAAGRLPLAAIPTDFMVRCMLCNFLPGAFWIAFERLTLDLERRGADPAQTA